MGVDVNPDGVALATISADGNLLRHAWLGCDRMRFASRDKRNHDIRLLAKAVVEQAQQQGGSLVVERLAFKRKKLGKRFNRMSHNFVYRRLLEAIHSRAASQGVVLVEVQPAFTSVLGLLKYADQYSLNRHTAAALVIARRGLGLLETQTHTDKFDEPVRGRVTLV
jgi:IS605 OrfB family transposase